MDLWYKSSAKEWNEALPIGNGHIGAMVFGDCKQEKLMLNDETIWYRGKADRNNPSSKDYLEKIRSALVNEDIEEAERLIALTMFATPRDQSHYEMLGELYLTHTNYEGRLHNYKRRLDLERAVVSVEYNLDNNFIQKEYFTSFNSNALYLKICASKNHSLDYTVNLGRNKRFSDEVYGNSINQAIMMHAHAGGRKGVGFQVGCKLLDTDGDVAVLGETIVIEHATYIYLVLATVSDYYGEISHDDCLAKLLDLSDKVFFNEKEQHISEYQKQFKRIILEFYDKPLSYLPTDERLNRFKEGQEDLELLNILFDYGRYLLISSSQPNGLPANLQGIWCADLNPIWGSKYTININTQMNYWMVGPCNLYETELPLFEMINNLRENGRVTAKKMYGARGFTAHHNTDGFFDTAPQSHAMGAAIWTLTVPWLCTHIWEYYQYFQDKEVLNKYLPVFQEMFEFYQDYLFEYQDYLVTGPSVSPENKYQLANGIIGNVCLSPSIDNQILRFFLNCYQDILTILEKDEGQLEEIKQMYDKLPPIQIGKHGQIQEWMEDYQEVEIGHRHISHLFGLYPGNEIDIVQSPDLAEAAKITIQRRLSGAKYLDETDRNNAIDNWLSTGLCEGTRTGWSAAWLVHFFARLYEGDKSYNELQGMLRNCILPNLFADHPPFQIDGNLGLVSGMCEMLIQSHNNRIVLLPAWPKSIANGKYENIRTRGGCLFSVSWENGEINHISIKGKENDHIKLFIPNEWRSANITEDQMDIILNQSGVWEYNSSEF
ncbi:alpha-L-fucosidase 2 [Granulicatella balaenopterae]|uniref:Alpha-L-fucosidase 2 n=1 Tax=Granulicatella balaenopterae TaxID=137733 RepID=A0A1H9J183_9LACT|nr:glycoside hydrolase family 95 protein [Granulicatella balaenopterae]SEQ80556.1 alpha-L-fucosidase 2 [Granulicatella balaenopterae]